MTTTNSDENIVLSNLKFYSLLKRDEKIDQSQPLSVTSNGFINNLYRTFTLKPDRYANLRHITDIVNKSFEFLDVYLKEKEKYKLKIEFILNDITKLLKDGLPNLKITYEKDRFFLCQIDSLAESISLKLYDRNIFREEKIVEKEKIELPSFPLVNQLPPLPTLPSQVIVDNNDSKKKNPEKETKKEIINPVVNQVKVFGVPLPGVNT